MQEGLLLLQVVGGSLGAGYLLFAKRQQRILPLLCGISLIVLPWLTDNLWLSLLGTLLLAVAPFYWRE